MYSYFLHSVHINALQICRCWFCLFNMDDLKCTDSSLHLRSAAFKELAIRSLLLVL